jgi:putative membrane protein
MTRQPGFADDGPVRGSSTFIPATDVEATESASLGPGFLEVDTHAQRGQIDLGWEPESLTQRMPSVSSVSLFPWGVLLLVVGWLALSAVGFVADQFARSAVLGVLTLILFGCALALISRGVWTEAKAYRDLQRVDALRTELARADIALGEARSICRAWVRSLARHLAEAEATETMLDRAASVEEIKTILRDRVLAQLRQAADQRGRRAAVAGGAAVAITPSPALDGVLAGMRGVALIRQVAMIYGLRPGLAVTVGLLRRVAWTVASVSGTELLSRAVADQVLERLPVIKHLAGAIPGTSVAAIRLYRLAGITAAACSPLPD